jgi:acetyltransferase
VLADAGVDVVITIFVPPVNVDPVGVARRIFEATRGATKPVLGCFMAREQVVAAIKGLDHSWFPVYDYPEQAVRAAWHLVRARRLRDDDLGRPETFPDVDHARIDALTAAGTGTAGSWLSAADAWGLLAAAGIPATPLRTARTPEEAVAAAAALGGPVALKLDGEAFLHKTDVGGVLLGLSTPTAVREGAERLVATARARAPGAPYRLLVQPMAAPGLELVLGAKVDPVFGPVLMVGFGGVDVEIWRDVAFGVVPLTRRLAERMVRRLRGFPLLAGSRGRPPADVGAVVTALLRLAAVVEAHPRILEIEVNPLVATPRGVTAVDARARVGPPPGPPA